jgi:hypothetical protein
MIMHLPSLACRALILVIGVIAASPATAQQFRNAPFWTVPSDTRHCRASFEGIGPFTQSRNLVRQAWPNDDGVNFYTHLGMRLAQAIGGRNVNEFKSFLLTAAQGQAYTVATHVKGQWSPVYVQSNLMRQLAMSIIFLETRGLLSAAEKTLLIRWGAAMVDTQKGTRGNESSDSLLASGMAMLTWGNITGDTRLMRAGYRQFMKGYPYVLDSIGQLRRHPGHASIPVDRLSLEDEYNVALQHALEGAAILNNLGVNLFAVERGGRTLHDAVDWWAAVVATRPPSLQSYRAWSHNFHLGWIPIYLHLHPDRPVAARLRALERDVTGRRVPPFRAASLGGSTHCLW